MPAISGCALRPVTATQIAATRHTSVSALTTPMPRSSMVLKACASRQPRAALSSRRAALAVLVLVARQVPVAPRVLVAQQAPAVQQVAVLVAKAEADRQSLG